MREEEIAKLATMTDEELFALKAEYIPHYEWLAHFEGDDGDSDMYYCECIWPIDVELKKRGLLWDTFTKASSTPKEH